LSLFGFRTFILTRGSKGAEVPLLQGMNSPLTETFFIVIKIEDTSRKVTLDVLKKMWRAREKSNKVQLSFKYRVYPTRGVEEKNSSG